jgi:hypothetical protein
VTARAPSKHVVHVSAERLSYTEVKNNFQCLAKAQYTNMCLTSRMDRVEEDCLKSRSG